MRLSCNRPSQIFWRRLRHSISSNWSPAQALAGDSPGGDSIGTDMKAIVIANSAGPLRWALLCLAPWPPKPRPLLPPSSNLAVLPGALNAGSSANSGGSEPLWHQGVPLGVSPVLLLPENPSEVRWRENRICDKQSFFVYFVCIFNFSCILILLLVFFSSSVFLFHYISHPCYVCLRGFSSRANP